VLATEFCGSSVTSNSRPQARTDQYLAMNPHIRYGRSDRRGFVLMDLRPQSGAVLFQALDDVRDAGSGVSTVAAFTLPDGRPGAAPGA
jgi:alkaline phosphatase D